MKGITEITVKLNFFPGHREFIPGPGYMPHFVVHEEYLGIRFLEIVEKNEVDRSAVVRVALMYDGVDYSELMPKVDFQIREGGTTVGTGVVMQIHNGGS